MLGQAPLPPVTQFKNTVNFMKRYFLLAAKIIIGVEVFWLVVGNLLLNTPAGPWLASIKQEKFAMNWSSGWTPYPARVSLSDITVRITTWSTETLILSLIHI